MSGHIEQDRPLMRDSIGCASGKVSPGRILIIFGASSRRGAEHRLCLIFGPVCCVFQKERDTLVKYVI
jgi:hypothetical protein